MPWPPFTTAARSFVGAHFFPRNGNGILHSLLGGPPSFCPIMAQMTRNCTALAAPSLSLARSLPLRFSLVSLGSGRGRFLWYLVTFMQPGPSGGGQWRGGTSGRGQTDMRAPCPKCTLHLAEVATLQADPCSRKIVWLSGFLFFYNLDNPSFIPREPENPSKGFGEPHPCTRSTP